MKDKNGKIMMIKLKKLLTENTHWYVRSIKNRDEINPKNMKMVMKYDARHDSTVVATFMNGRYILLGRYYGDGIYKYGIKWKKHENENKYKWLVEFDNIEKLNTEFGLKLNKKQIQKEVDKLEDKYHNS